jgi:uncharacterized membrane protein (DUF106 family)
LKAMSFELTVTPYSTLFILLISSVISLVTSLTNRLLTNREQMKAWSQEIAAWRADSMKATRTGDKKLKAKVDKQQKHIMQMQSKMSWQSMKTSFIWFIPLMLLWVVFLTPTYANAGAVAYLPGIGRDPWPLPLFWWYLLCSFLSNTLITRLLGMSLGVD